MAGGKETPRQKMIGMMYLVLTALLALNVSKEIVIAFITLNDKLDQSTMSIEYKNDMVYQNLDRMYNVA
ncbi:MAG TPA: gliding motility protein GldM, partial [Flavobacteriales bacterium]|nr:gliding motility protein GldM [Flavobacteriales bacterium]